MCDNSFYFCKEDAACFDVGSPQQSAGDISEKSISHRIESGAKWPWILLECWCPLRDPLFPGSELYRRVSSSLDRPLEASFQEGSGESHYLRNDLLYGCSDPVTIQTPTSCSHGDHVNLGVRLIRGQISARTATSAERLNLTFASTKKCDPVDPVTEMKCDRYWAQATQKADARLA